MVRCTLHFVPKVTYNGPDVKETSSSPSESINDRFQRYKRVTIRVMKKACTVEEKAKVDKCRK